LQQEPPASAVKVEPGRNWGAAIPISLVTGLIFWALSSPGLELNNHLPLVVLLWAPIATLAALIFLGLTSGQGYRRIGWLAGGLALACLYVLLFSRIQGGESQRTYQQLMAIHLPLLCWVALGFYVLGAGSGPSERFAFLIKSIEVMITAGLYLITGVAFGAITVGLFNALSVQLPDVVNRLIVAGGFGLLPVLAVASVYDPRLSALEQDFSQGLSKLIATMMRLILPLTLLVLVVYVVAIPFSFMQPFTNRDVLIVYNLMLFAIMGLLVGATPLSSQELTPRLDNALRLGIMAVAALTVLVSLYALSATVYRTVSGGLTINRLTIIGWNTINIALLTLALARLLRGEPEMWAERLKTVYRLATQAYLVWAAFLLIAIPLFFR
jgi:hypothetical protein